jgi:LytR cell envelope-related transcriptional attenuator
MGSVPFAFSVHHFINSVGADAGFASIIGLAILVLLYFAQARETAALREQAYEWAQRVSQLEGRIAQLTRQQPPPAPPPGTATGATSAGATQAGRTGAPVVPAPAGIAAPGPATAAATGGIGASTRPLPAAAVPSPATSRPPGAPAGVGAPALTAATKLIPSGGPAVAAAAEQNSAEQPSDLTAVGRPLAAAAPSASSSAPAAPAPATAAPSASASAPAAPAPATAAGGANGASGAASPPRPFGVAGSSPEAPVADPLAAPSPPRIQIGPSGQTATGRRQTVPPRGQPPRSQPQAGGSSPGRRIVAGLLVLLVVGAIVAGLLLLTGGSDSSSSQSTSAAAGTTAATTQHHRRSKSGGVTPSSVTVAVLNGTATNQLAHKVAEKLAGVGYKQGQVAGAADQTHTATVVAYFPGQKASALAVAKALNLGPASVQPVDPGTQSLACTPGAACAANVVVTVGSDLANTP